MVFFHSILAFSFLYVCISTVITLYKHVICQKAMASVSGKLSPANMKWQQNEWSYNDGLAASAICMLTHLRKYKRMRITASLLSNMFMKHNNKFK